MSRNREPGDSANEGPDRDATDIAPDGERRPKMRPLAFLRHVVARIVGGIITSAP